MKVLWVCNVIIPEAGKYLDLPSSNTAGWLSGLYSGLCNHSEVEMCIIAPYDGNRIKMATNEKVTFYVFPRLLASQSFNKIADEFKPDIVQIHGTEYSHSKEIITGAKNIKFVISIQGLVSIYTLHYYGYLPVEEIKKKALRDYIKNNSIIMQRKKFENRGVDEVIALENVKYVIGRTCWDETCTHLINPKLRYYKCNESLRDSFYKYQWNINECEKHSIFFSQGTVPYKGLHLALMALPYILREYPDTVLYVAGTRINETCTIHQRLKITTYGKYLNKLIYDLNLFDHVKFLGSLNEIEMCKRMRYSNVFLSSSAIENSPNSLGEAMLMGMPCISSDVGGVSDMLLTGIEGILYPADEYYMISKYVCRVFGDSQFAVTIGNAARTHALKTHDKVNNINTLISIYRDIIESK